MVKKGVISVFDPVARTAEVIIPELDNIVTPMIPVSREISILDVVVGDKCVVAFFSNNFADGVVLTMI